jgi:hypothetical protein
MLLLLCAGLKAFFTTPQLEPIDKVANSLALGTSPIVRALFDPEGGMQVRLGGVQQENLGVGVEGGKVAMWVVVPQ